MMYTLKGKCTLVTFLLFALCGHGGLLRQTQRQQQYNPAIPPLPWHLAPPWEYILREIILKSVTPSLLDANTPYERPLDASFYGGPVSVYSHDDASVVLSRGNVYHLLNGHWMLCQDGCIDCEPCLSQRNPLFKWILRSVKRVPTSDPAQHDLQLTIMPQAEDHFYASNLWPNSYVYVTSQRERSPFSIIRTQHDNEQNSLPNLENSFSEKHHRSKDFWRLTERDSIAGQDGIARQDDRDVARENSSTEKSEKEGSIEQKHKFRNMRRHRTRLRSTVKPATTVRNFTAVTTSDREKANQLEPKLILGTDQQGQKHLVHVLLADNPPITSLPVNSIAPNHPISWQFATGQVVYSNKTIPKRERQTYQRIFRRIFDSLNTHRRSIENFLESPTNDADGHGTPPSLYNTQIAGFSRNERDISSTSADFEATRLANTSPSPSQRYQRYGNRYDYENMRQNINSYYPAYRNINLADILRNRESMDFDWGRERRRIRVNPYLNSIKGNFPKINSSISTLNSNNSSIDAFFNSKSPFVINPAKQIYFNDTAVDKVFVVGNDSVESSSIVIDSENERLFTRERLKSGANRKFEVSRDPSRIIVTAKSSVIRREHEALSSATILQITTSKIFANSSHT